MILLAPMAAALTALTYRRPKPVRDLIVYTATLHSDSYYVCPRCRISIDREFTAYCDRCGQCLNWEGYEHARVLYK